VQKKKQGEKEAGKGGKTGKKSENKKGAAVGASVRKKKKGGWAMGWRGTNDVSAPRSPVQEHPGEPIPKQKKGKLEQRGATRGKEKGTPCSPKSRWGRKKHG